MIPKHKLPKISKTLIFNSSWSGSLIQKATTVGLFTLFWLVWLSLWGPVFTFGAWLLAPVYTTWVTLDAIENSLPTLWLITGTGIALGSFLGLWGSIQLFIKANKTENKIKNVSSKLIAQSQGLQEIELELIQESQKIDIYHDNNGNIVKLELSDPLNTTCLTVKPDFKSIKNNF